MTLTNSSSSTTSESGRSTPIDEIITKNQWINSIDEQHFEKSILNRLILNFFLKEGFKEAIEAFSNETGISINNIDLTSIDDRGKIRQFIENGKILDAIYLINKKAPDLFDRNKQLDFQLKQQHLIELIRLNLIDESLSYAQTHLSQLVHENVQMRQDLEKTIALLIFDQPLQSSYGYLMDLSHRKQVANQINTALLNYKNEESESDLSMLVRMVTYIRDKLDKRRLHYPKLIDLSNGKLEDPQI